MPPSASAPPAPLAPSFVRTRIDPAAWGIVGSDQLPDHDAPVGQDRALEALQFGLSARGSHSHIFVAGPKGTGRSTIVLDQAKRALHGRPVPDDWIIVHNFDDPDHPRCLSLPAGQGRLLVKEFRRLVDDLYDAIPGALASRDYRSRYQTIVEGAQDERRTYLEVLEVKARAISIGVEDGEQSLQLVPLQEDGKPLSPDQYQELSEPERKDIEDRERSLKDDILIYVDHARTIQDRADRALEKLDHRTLSRVLNPALARIRRKVKLSPDVAAFLKEFADVIIDDPGAFLPPENESPFDRARGPNDRDRFDINLLVDNGDLQAPPVIAEWHPTFANVVGRAERRLSFGALETSHMLLRAGALLRANGGILVMSAQDLLSLPFVYAALKRVLRDGSCTIEDPDDGVASNSTVTVRPDPIPVDVQVVLIGSFEDWSMLTSLDENFAKLFRIRADFGDTMPLRPDTLATLLRYVAQRARSRSMLPITADGMAAIVEEAIRLAGRHDELTLQLADLTDFLAEADIWGRQRLRDRLDRADIEFADQQRRRRDGLFHEQLLQQYQRGTILLDTRGARIGQVNGLAVISTGQFDYGLPVRITAKTFAGSEGVVNIERETELSGQIHSKAVLILSGFLGATYAQKKPLSLSASITFEQNYNLIEGDSASVAEAVALLSSLADLPVRQDLAVTGSMSQHGEVQPVGGINEKIEGFYFVCQARGLTGTQGVLIPAANVSELQLQPHVAYAVEQGLFHVFSVEHVTQALELLTGTPIGVMGRNGKWTAGSIHSRVAARIRQYADRDERDERSGS